MAKYKFFRGIVIPPLADTPEGREAVRRGYEGASTYCFLADVKNMVGECSEAGRCCHNCIACLNSGDERRKREVFEQYDREIPVKGRGGMPELKPGMVVRVGFGEYYLIVSDRKSDCVAYRYAKNDSGGLLLRDVRSFEGGDPSIEAVYGDTVLKWLSPHNLAGILRGDERYRIWKRPDPVKEMTVDEISEALGYKVKVVGSEKADD